MHMKLYIAYGSNMNIPQMARRCPNAKVEGVSTIPGYELVFRGPEGAAVATIEPKEGSSVPVVIWSINPFDERSLDCYEGFPRLYTKQDFEVELKGNSVKAMAYVMTQGRKLGGPSAYYLKTISDGYESFGLDRRPLAAAARKCRGQSTVALKDKLNALGAEQKSGDLICPRCGCPEMNPVLHRNALSRRANIFICDECGMEEAIHDWTGEPDKLADWYILRRKRCCNS